MFVDAKYCNSVENLNATQILNIMRQYTPKSLNVISSFLEDTYVQTVGRIFFKSAVYNIKINET